MSHDRNGRCRAFRPSLDDQRLESRQLLTSVSVALREAQYLLTHPSARAAQAVHNPPGLSPQAPIINKGPVYNHGIAAVNTARGGASAIVAIPDGSRFRVSLSLADNQYPPALTAETGVNSSNQVPSAVVAPQGTVRVYPMPGGEVGIIVDGSTQYQQLTIDPLPKGQLKGYAHSFGYNAAGRTNVLKIGSLQVNSGQIQAILGYHSADLTGPLSIGGTGTVDRIAFNSLQPGAAIGVGGTLNTLDIANNATLTAGVGINIGRDLNLFTVGGNLTLSNGANLVVGRFVGLTPQPPKGTATGSNILAVNQALIGAGTSLSTIVPSVSAFIGGNFSIGPNSTFAIGSGIANSSLVNGSQVAPAVFLINGALNYLQQSQINIPNLTTTLTFNNPNPPPPTVTTTVTLVGNQLFNATAQNFNTVIFNKLVARNGITINGVQVVPHA